MIHSNQVCQYSFKKNPNTTKFWDSKIIKNKEVIYNYPIYKLKNNYIINTIRNVSGNFLDIGIGYGFLEAEILERKFNLNLFGIDISGVAIENANKNLKGVFQKASIKSIPYANDFFDCVVALDVIEHLSVSVSKKSMKEIHRVVKRNGMVVISVPTNETHIDRRKNGHLVEYNIDSITNLLENSGFKVKKIKLFSAFRSWAYFKNLVNDIFCFRKPNLIILVAIKY